MKRRGYSLKSPRLGRDMKSPSSPRSPSARGAAAQEEGGKGGRNKGQNEREVEEKRRKEELDREKKRTSRRKRIHLVGPRSEICRCARGKRSGYRATEEEEKRREGVELTVVHEEVGQRDLLGFLLGSWGLKMVGLEPGEGGASNGVSNVPILYSLRKGEGVG